MPYHSASPVCVGVMLLGWLTHSAAIGEEPRESLSLADVAAGRATIVDLAYPLNEHSAYWPGENYEPFRLQTIATLEKDGVLSKAFSAPEHIGTHLDAPNHFAAGAVSVDQLAPQQFFAPGVMIDVAGRAAEDADFRLTREHVQIWEAEHGPIPRGAIVLLNTGWGRFWGQKVRFQNRDVQGRLHFPGYAEDAARYLVEERKVKGLGIDTMSIDYGLSRDFIVHKVANQAGVYGLENVAHLDQLPARGFYLVVAPIKIETGTGGPTRIFALMPKDK